MKCKIFKKYIPFFILIIWTIFIASCDKNTFTKDGKLRFSKDTVMFDTSFTQIGSSTHRITIRNTNSKDIQVKRIYLEKGSASSFKMNVDGYAGYMHENVEILAGDSIFIFVESTIDGTGGNGQLFADDNIVFDYEQGPEKIYLAAPGSDAIYFFPNDTLQDNMGRKYPVRILQGNHVWKEGKPIVIVGTLVVDAGATLTMTPGTQVHMFNGSMLWVYKGGTLKILGERNRKVVIEGTRLGIGNTNLAGQWDRIWINEGSVDHEIRNAIIKNGRLGVQAGGLDMSDGSSPRLLKIENTSIYNMTSSCILAMNYNIEAKNLFMNNFYQYGIALVLGGNYHLNHITISGYQGGTRQSPGLYFSNAYSNYMSDLDLKVENSIIYGTNPTELGFDQAVGTQFDFLIQNSLLKIDQKINTETPSYVSIQKNIDPKFYAPYHYDPSLKSESPAINGGNITFSGLNVFDYHGKNRIEDGNPDMGCAEYKGD